MKVLRTGVFVLFVLLVPVSCEGKRRKHRTASFDQWAEMFAHVIEETLLERIQQALS